jgi:hypothetical protein
MTETPISRGFRSRRQEQNSKGRVPPGQYVTTDFPVLSAGPTPQIKVADWTLAPSRWIADRQMDLGRIRGSSADHPEDGHPLRDQVVKARYHVAGRDIR